MEPIVKNETIQTTPSPSELKEWQAIIDSSPLGIIIVIIIAFAKVRKEYLFDKQELEKKLDVILDVLKSLESKSKD